MFDLTTYCIPNQVNVAGGIAGLVISAIGNGMRGIGMGLLCMCIPVLGLFILYLYKIMGAGDIKLLSAIGSFVWFDVIKIVVVAFILTALYGLCIILLRVVRMVREYLKNDFISSDYCKINRFTKIHLSIPIALASVLIMFGGW